MQNTAIIYNTNKLPHVKALPVLGGCLLLSAAVCVAQEMCIRDRNLPQIEASDIHARLGLEKGKYILLSAHREENIDTEENFRSLFTAVNAMAAQYDLSLIHI